jgi:nicotinate-nucleotide adenylyltransferase
LELKHRHLCFGGSFNPIHLGHLRCAQAVANTENFERVVLIPSAQPPHKPRHPDLAAAEHRLAMCRLAAKDNPLLAVDDRELHRSGPSYTFDTVQSLLADGWPSVSWLIGADMLRELPNWHRSAELLKIVDFVIIARPGWRFDWSTMPEAYRHLQNRVTTAPLIDISATDIRRRVRAGESISELVSPSVEEYIHQHNLWR